MSAEIEYRYVKGKGWVAGYKDLQPIELSELQGILKRLVRAAYPGTAGLPGGAFTVEDHMNYRLA